MIYPMLVYGTIITNAPLPACGLERMPTTKHEVYPPDDLARRVEEYAQGNDLSLSKAWKELARRGLQSMEDSG